MLEIKRIVNRHETTVICAVYKNFIIIDHFHTDGERQKRYRAYDLEIIN